MTGKVPLPTLILLVIACLSRVPSGDVLLGVRVWYIRMIGFLGVPGSIFFLGCTSDACLCLSPVFVGHTSCQWEPVILLRDLDFPGTGVWL